MFANACETGLEGIISKEANAPYVGGRQRSWLKIKCSRRQEFIIVGFSDARKGERALGALYLAYQKHGTLQYAGKVGTGFSMRSARELAGRLAKIGVQTPVLSRRKPPDSRLANGVRSIGSSRYCFAKLRSPSGLQMAIFGTHLFRVMREDKDPSQVNQEAANANIDHYQGRGRKEGRGKPGARRHLHYSSRPRDFRNRTYYQGRTRRILRGRSFFDPAANQTSPFKPAAVPVRHR